MSLDSFGFVCRIVGRTHHWEASQVLVLLKQTDTEGRQTPEVGREVSGIGIRLVMILCEDFMLSKIFQLLADRRPALWDVVVTFGDRDEVPRVPDNQLEDIVSSILREILMYSPLGFIWSFIIHIEDLSIVVWIDPWRRRFRLMCKLCATAEISILLCP